MEKQLRKLRLLFRITKLNPEMFYSITVTKYVIQLQGYYTAKTAIICGKYGTSIITKDGYTEIKKNKIQITLT